MKNREYWQRRSEKKLIDDLKEADSLLKSFKSAYEEAEIRISNDIQLLLGRFMTENGIDRVRAMEILEGKEFKSWRMSLEAYMEEIQRLGESPEARALLLEVNALSTRSQINRLEALQGNISANMARLARVQEKGVEEHLSKVFREDYYRSLYDHFKEGNPIVLELMAKHRVKISDSRVLAVLRTPWSGRDFSANIWRREHKIAEKVKAAVAQNVIAGKSIDRIVRDMTQELGKDYKRHAKLLIQTEIAYVNAQAQLETYKRLGVEECEYVATLDSKTSKLCQGMDGKVIKVAEAVSGVNYPPMHPGCRSTTTIYEEDQEGTRVARGADGKIYKVDRKMKYPEWKEKYVNDAATKEDLEQYQRYLDVLGERISSNYEEFYKLKKSERWVSIKRDYKVVKAISKNKGITDKNRAKQLYYDFSERDVHVGTHFLERYMEREFKKNGDRVFTFDQVVELAKRKPNYIDTSNGRDVIVDGKLSIVQENGKCVTMRYGRLGKTWKKI